MEVGRYTVRYTESGLEVAPVVARDDCSFLPPSLLLLLLSDCFRVLVLL